MSKGMQAKGPGSIIGSREYLAALDEARRLRNLVRSANPFTLEKAFSESESFFSRLSRDSPDIYGLLKVLHAEIRSMAMQTRSGCGAIVD